MMLGGSQIGGGNEIIGGSHEGECGGLETVGGG